MELKSKKPADTKLADSLERAKNAATKEIVQSSDISRIDRERLLRRGYLHKIINGWYFLAAPHGEGESTSWYASYRDFLRLYLRSRFSDKYCLSAESSLKIHAESNVIPKQIVVITADNSQTLLNLPHGASLFMYADKNSLPDKIAVVNGLNLMPLHVSLCRVPPSFFEQNPHDAEIALILAEKGTEISRVLLEGGYRSAAARIIGAYRFLGYRHKAEEISGHLKNAGYSITPVNPFQPEKKCLSVQTGNFSPYAARIGLLWKDMREQVISVFPDDPGMLKDRQKYFLKMDEIYTHDAYHSLSIEGYRVSYELIEKIRSGRWNPDNDPDDFQQLQALTAKGYFNAFTAVKKSIGRILDGESPGDVAESDLQKWYHALFSTLVETGSMKQYDLLGYRNDRVFIRSSLHVPPPSYALTDSMNAFFSLMKSETGAGVRAVLGHFMFTFIHPYMDGNGRIARFLMNVMLASGGFDWTVIRTENRDEYMNALETASVKGDIRPFAEFVLTEMRVEWGKQNQAF